MVGLIINTSMCLIEIVTFVQVIYTLLFFTVEFPEEVHGVLREGWYNVNYDSKKAPTMRENPAFKLAVQGQIILQDFDAPNNVGEKYVQRLTSYLQVNIFLRIQSRRRLGSYDQRLLWASSRMKWINECLTEWSEWLSLWSITKPHCMTTLSIS